MKKIFFIAAFGVAAFTSAKTKISNHEVVKFKESNKTATLVYQWLEVVSPCGAVYYLPYESYIGCSVEELEADLAKFNYAKCGVTGFEMQFPYA